MMKQRKGFISHRYAQLMATVGPAKGIRHQSTPGPSLSVLNAVVHVLETSFLRYMFMRVVDETIHKLLFYFHSFRVYFAYFLIKQKRHNKNMARFIETGRGKKRQTHIHVVFKGYQREITC